MFSKSKIRERLETLRELPGVLPTRAERSDGTARLSQSLRSEDIETALSASREQLLGMSIEATSQDTAQELYSDPLLRDQMIGFADAGMNFFHGDEEYWRLRGDERAARGGNGAVNRVFVQHQRLLLETSRVVLRMADDASENARDDVLTRHEVILVDGKGLPPNVLRGHCNTVNVVDACLALMEEDAVDYAEPDFIEHVGQRFTPNDPLFGQQWHHINIQSEAAWDLTLGEGVNIAVIDNGFHTSHTDLRFGPASGWYRTTPDLQDADFVLGTAGMPSESHGTACAGMISASADNGVGGCGVAPGADIRMIACLSDQVGTQSTLARAVGYAAAPSSEGGTAAGADIIACSLGPNGANWEMRAVLNEAIDVAATQGRDGKGCPILWACTNGNYEIVHDEVCSHPEVMAVGRSTRDDADDGSGYGPQLEFLAPGRNVFLPGSGDGHQPVTGTSFAAPCAAGIGALALSKKPDLTASELRTLMRDTCDKVGSLPYIGGRNTRFGHGRANAANAVAEAIRLSTGV
ncbi:MAG: S8 family serine peptidase [Paracoccaceae bacterium]